MTKSVFSRHRIAVIGAKGIPPKQGGIEHHCAELYTRIAKVGHRVDLYARASYTDTPWYHSYFYEGVRVISLPSLCLPGIDALIAGLLGAIAVTLRRYDIVHFHAVGLALFCGLPRLLTSAKIVVTCHGLDWQRSKWGKLSSLLIYLGERAAVAYAHEIIVVSETLQNYFWKMYGRETIYIPNAPATFLRSDPSLPYVYSLRLKPRRYIVFVGRLVPEKAPDLLIQAFQALAPVGWKLVLVGGHSDTPAYMEQLNQLVGDNENIHFTGQLLGSRLAEVVQQAGLFVLPSNLEGMPISLMEAMQEEIPVVASNIQPHQELVGEERGLLFQRGNLESCVQALRWAIAQPEEMEEKAKLAKKYIRLNYSWDQSAVDTVGLYQFLSYSFDTTLIKQDAYPLP
jgi:glycosyltransferase involved in cell wall biosynthesis